jgi:bacteriocin-like protein
MEIIEVELSDEQLAQVYGGIDTPPVVVVPVGSLQSLELDVVGGTLTETLTFTPPSS